MARISDFKLIPLRLQDSFSDTDFFYHNDPIKKDLTESRKAIQEILDKSELVIGHNLKFDMSWLYQCGFTYQGKLYDTMLGEYIINRGEKKSVSLKESCKRRGISLKSDILATYMNEGYGIEEIPMDKLEEYGKQDVKITRELYNAQVEAFNNHANANLIPTRNLMNDFLQVLIDMEMNGNHVDLEKLDVVEKN